MKLTDPVIRQGPQVRVGYLAFDSLGVKAACVGIATPDVKLLIDPGCSVEPDSFPLPLAQREELAGRYEAAIYAAGRDADVLVVSHYHLDHFLERRDPALYRDRVVFAKDPDDLPARQAEAARRLFQTIDGLPKELIIADGRRFRFGRTMVAFSAAVPHGAEDAEPGRVIMTEISRGREKVIVTSDVCGPVSRATAELICQARPSTVVLDGYPTYQLGQFAADHELVQSIINTIRILSAPGLKELVIDHHLARDYRYPAFYRLVFDRAAGGKVRLATAAEMLGQRPAALEGYQNYGPTRWTRWTPLDAESARAVLTKAVAAGRTTADWLDEFDRFLGGV